MCSRTVDDFHTSAGRPPHISAEHFNSDPRAKFLSTSGDEPCAEIIRAKMMKRRNCLLIVTVMGGGGGVRVSSRHPCHRARCSSVANE